MRTTNLILGCLVGSLSTWAAPVIAFSEETKVAEGAQSVAVEVPLMPATGVEGIAGDIDGRRRSPVLTVGTHMRGDIAIIKADAYLPNDDMAKYPIQFDFFINRRLYSSQIRSPEQPGAVGVELGSDVAALPFNFAVVAKVIHPNRVFSTVFQGVVEQLPYNLSFTSCTLTQSDSEDSDTASTAQGVNSIQQGSTALTVTFSPVGEGESVPSRVAVGLNVVPTADKAGSVSGSAVLTVAEEELSYEVSGTIDYNPNEPTLSIESDDGEITVQCR